MYVRQLAICTFLVSLVLTPYKTWDPEMEMYGITVLLLGWMAVFDHYIFAWYANPLMIFSWYWMRKAPLSTPLLCVCLNVLAFLLALDFNKVESLGWDSSGDIILGKVIGLGAGSYVWLGSLALTTLASVLHMPRWRRSVPASYKQG